MVHSSLSTCYRTASQYERETGWGGWGWGILCKSTQTKLDLHSPKKLQEISKATTPPHPLQSQLGTRAPARTHKCTCACALKHMCESHDTELVMLGRDGASVIHSARLTPGNDRRCSGRDRILAPPTEPPVFNGDADTLFHKVKGHLVQKIVLNRRMAVCNGPVLKSSSV